MATAKFCPECGTATEGAKFCPECGTPTALGVQNAPARPTKPTTPPVGEAVHDVWRVLPDTLRSLAARQDMVAAGLVLLIVFVLGVAAYLASDVECTFRFGEGRTCDRIWPWEGEWGQ